MLAVVRCGSWCISTPTRRLAPQFLNTSCMTNTWYLFVGLTCFCKTTNTHHISSVLLHNRQYRIRGDHQNISELAARVNKSKISTSHLWYLYIFSTYSSSVVVRQNTAGPTSALRMPTPCDPVLPSTPPLILCYHAGCKIMVACLS